MSAPAVICVRCRRPLGAAEAGLCAACHGELPELETYWREATYRAVMPALANGLLWQRARFVVADGPHAGLRGRRLWVTVHTPQARETRDHVTGASATEFEYETHLVNRSGLPVGVACSLVELEGGPDAFRRDVARELVDVWLQHREAA